MFYTLNYRHGWIHCGGFKTATGQFTSVYRPQVAPWVDLGEFKSLHAAKLAITRHAKQLRAQRAQDATEHHRFIQNSILARRPVV